MSLRALFVLAPLILMLSACQQAAWKAGATADDLKRDEQACRAQTPADDAAIKQCLRGKGWAVTDFSPATESDTAENNPAPNTAISPTAQPVVTPLSKTASPKSGAVASAENNAVKSENPADNAAIADAPTSKRAPDPLQRQSVQSWWKAGAQAADFNTDANACLEQLGAQHTPDYTQHLYTRAMVSCLRARGWFAGRDPVYTPLR